jgi:hypothetical protein
MWKPTMEGSQRHHFREFRNKPSVPRRGCVLFEAVMPTFYNLVPLENHQLISQKISLSIRIFPINTYERQQFPLISDEYQ